MTTTLPTAEQVCADLRQLPLTIETIEAAISLITTQVAEIERLTAAVNSERNANDLAHKALDEAIKNWSQERKRAEASLAAVKAERDAMRTTLEWMLARDDENGSLPPPYREKIDAALSLDAQGEK